MTTSSPGHSTASAAASASTSRSAKRPHTSRRWTRDEDRVLLGAVTKNDSKNGTQWDGVLSDFVKTFPATDRTKKALKRHYDELQKKGNKKRAAQATETAQVTSPGSASHQAALGTPVPPSRRLLCGGAREDEAAVPSSSTAEGHGEVEMRDEDDEEEDRMSAEEEHYDTGADMQYGEGWEGSAAAPREDRTMTGDEQEEVTLGSCEHQGRSSLHQPVQPPAIDATSVESDSRSTRVLSRPLLPRDPTTDKYDYDVTMGPESATMMRFHNSKLGSQFDILAPNRCGIYAPRPEPLRPAPWTFRVELDGTVSMLNCPLGTTTNSGRVQVENGGGALHDKWTFTGPDNYRVVFTRDVK